MFVHTDARQAERDMASGRAYVLAVAGIGDHVRRPPPWRVIPNGEHDGVPIVAFIHQPRMDALVAWMNARL